MANQNWNYWRFQIHWNKPEWVNPGSVIEQKIQFCVSSKEICLKDNNKTVRWVGHSILNSLDTIYSLKKKVTNDLQASLIGTII